MNRDLSKSLTLGIIPARFGSTRFPGKMLAPLNGKTLLQNTVENAWRSGCFDKVIIATDDKRIYDHVSTFGFEAIMTPTTCSSGSERLAYTLSQRDDLRSYPIIVNIQGDEPVVAHNSFAAVIQALEEDRDAVVSTLITPLTDLSQFQRPSVVKCVRATNGRALYFSRAPIPANKTPHTIPKVQLFRHIGIYAYRRDFLLKYPLLPPTPLQLAEDLEQLKILEHGYSIATAIVDEVAVGVDTPEDLTQLEQWLCTANLSSQQEGSAPPLARG